MRFRKPIICSLLLFFVLLLTGCARNGESITLNIQLDDNLLSDEINLLYIEYVPAEWVDQVGWLFRTCPEDREKNSQAGHHFYPLSKQDKENDLQLVIFPMQGRDSQRREWLKKSEIYLGERHDAVLFYIEAWQVDDLDRRMREKTFAESFLQTRSQYSPIMRMLYANSEVLVLQEDKDAVIDFRLLRSYWESSAAPAQYWTDHDRDLFGEFGENRDCVSADINLPSGPVPVQLGCTFHPFAPPDGCINRENLSCDCREITPIPTTTPTVTLTPTASTTPTITPTKPTPTPSITPTYTNTPGPTPTFNIAPISRATSAAPAQCPSDGDPELPDLASAGTIGEGELEWIRIFLSEGGSVEDVQSELAAMGRDGMLLQRDLTSDGVPEVILTFPVLEVLGCTGGSYQRLLQVYPDDPTFPVLRVTIADLNGNAVPELVVETEFWGMHDYTLNVSVYEWDGEEFVSRMPERMDHPAYKLGLLYWESGRALMYNGSMKLGDVDLNGTIELVLRGGQAGGLVAMVSMPQLTEQHIWMWTGREFSLVDIRYDEPIYKFQAASIGDLYNLMGKYDDGIAAYQQAIFDSDLKIWNQQKIEAQYFGGDMDLFPNWDQLNYEQAERINMYARFRMLVVNYLIGNNWATETQYDSIQRIAAGGSSGKMYAELARAFTEKYQEEGSITQACHAAQQFARSNEEEILWPLGPSAYGEMWWGYDPEDICPFIDEDRQVH